MTLEEGIKFLFLLLGLAGSVWILRPVGRAIARKIEGQAVTDARALETMRDELLGEMDGLRQDVAQLSERLDFTERMLAKQQPDPRLGSGSR